MREASRDRYGGPEAVLLRDVARPMPGEGEVLIEVCAASLTLADTAFRQAKPFITRFFDGLFRPRRLILGSEFSGVVVATGPAGLTLVTNNRREFDRVPGLSVENWLANP